MELGALCRVSHPETVNEFGPWTALKLCALKNYVDIYTRILNDKRLKRLGFDGRAYVDVFAGSGVNLIGDHKTPLAGSSPIAAKFHFRDRPFHKYYGLEIDPAYTRALEARMDSLTPPGSFKIVEGDADKKLGAVLSELEDLNYHYLAFIDYEGIKGFSWQSLQDLLQHEGDLWITFICPGLARVQGRAKWSDGDRETLENMVGTDVVAQSEDLWQLEERFVEKIRKYRPKVQEIRVRSGDGYYYQLIFATKRTSGDSQYLSAVDNLKQRIERISGRFVEMAVDVLEGRKVDLDNFNGCNCTES